MQDLTPADCIEYCFPEARCARLCQDPCTNQMQLGKSDFLARHVWLPEGKQSKNTGVDQPEIQGFNQQIQIRAPEYWDSIWIALGKWYIYI